MVYIQLSPLGTVMNLAPGSIPRPQAPNPDIIATITRADPTLQHIDPTLIAMSFLSGMTYPPTAPRSGDTAPGASPIPVNVQR